MERSSRRPWATRRRASSTSSARALRMWPSAIACSASPPRGRPRPSWRCCPLCADPAVAGLLRRCRAAGRYRDGHARARPARRREWQHAAHQRRLRKRRQRRGSVCRGARCARDRHRQSGEPRVPSLAGGRARRLRRGPRRAGSRARARRRRRRARRRRERGASRAHRARRRRGARHHGRRLRRRPGARGDVQRRRAPAARSTRSPRSAS